MLDARATVYRALGVPDIVTAHNKLDAAASRILDTAAIDVSVEMPHHWQRQTQMDDTRRVVEATVTLLEEGTLDPLLGRYWHRGWFSDEEDAISSARRKLANAASDLHTYEYAEALSGAMLNALRDYVVAHPFED